MRINFFELRRFPFWMVVALAVTLSVPAWAEENLFARADAAWHKGELDKAKQLYEQSLEKGDLVPIEVVIAYSRIGTVKAALRDKQGALSAFRVAAAIDPEFELPPDSGPRAKTLYAQARKEAASQGEKLALELTVPKGEVGQRKPFKVKATIPEGFAVLVTKVIVTVTDTTRNNKTKKISKPAAATVEFEIPASMAQPGGRLKVFAAATDNNRNAWVVSEKQVVVGGMAPTDPNETPDFGEWGSGSDDPKKDDKGDGIDLLSGPWPWIAAGVLVVGGIVVFAATRPPDEVSVGAPTWEQ